VSRILLHTATHCNTLQHAATHCNANAREHHFFCQGVRAYIDIHIYVYIYICINVYTYIYKYIHMYLFKYTYIEPFILSRSPSCWVQNTATHCNTLQHTATHVQERIISFVSKSELLCDEYCNILQHTATYCNTSARENHFFCQGVRVVVSRNGYVLLLQLAQCDLMCCSVMQCVAECFVVVAASPMKPILGPHV